jgi:hypothetical protein
MTWVEMTVKVRQCRHPPPGKRKPLNDTKRIDTSRLGPKIGAREKTGLSQLHMDRASFLENLTGAVDVLRQS